jgi:CxxC motif-containing protein (DUF1111 family)
MVPPRPALAALLTAACAAPDDPLAGLQLVHADASDAPIAGLDDVWLDRFARGDALFEAPFRETTGLGPVYIRQSCASCHADDGRGPGVVEKFVLVGEDGATPDADQSALPWGHTARPQLAGGATTPLQIPDLPNLLVTTRAPAAIFGRGYLEAVRDDELLRLEAEQAQRSDTISGRVNRVPWTSAAPADPRFSPFLPGDAGLPGRFGLKGRVATLDEFAADALQGDMSITSPLRPHELPNPDGLTDDLRPGIDVTQETVDLLADYTRLVDIPARASVPGASIFEEVGCAVCHTPTLRTRADYPIPPLADIDAPVYTDLLLHDMGADAADGLTDAEAGPREWRTAPLIGLRHLAAYLHDGRADSVAAAISLHRGPGSEANAVIDQFEALAPEARATLLTFVESL